MACSWPCGACHGRHPDRSWPCGACHGRRSLRGGSLAAVPRHRWRRLRGGSLARSPAAVFHDIDSEEDSDSYVSSDEEYVDVHISKTPKKLQAGRVDATMCSSLGGRVIAACFTPSN